MSNKYSFIFYQVTKWWNDLNSVGKVVWPIISAIVIAGLIFVIPKLFWPEEPKLRITRINFPWQEKLDKKDFEAKAFGYNPCTVLDAITKQNVINWFLIPHTDNKKYPSAALPATNMVVEMADIRAFLRSVNYPSPDEVEINKFYQPYIHIKNTGKATADVTEMSVFIRLSNQKTWYKLTGRNAPFKLEPDEEVFSPDYRMIIGLNDCFPETIFFILKLKYSYKEKFTWRRHETLTMTSNYTPAFDISTDNVNPADFKMSSFEKPPRRLNTAKDE